MKRFIKLTAILFIFAIIVSGCDDGGQILPLFIDCYNNDEPDITKISHTTIQSIPTHVSVKIINFEQNNITSMQIVQSVTTGAPYTFILYDDGTHGDSTANDGLYEYTFAEEDDRYAITSEGHMWTATVVDSCGHTDIYTFDICDSNSAPTITDIGQESNTEYLPTHVWATINNITDNITSVEIVQSIADDTYPHLYFTLYDDGTHGDSTANDGMYEYTFVEDVDNRYYIDIDGHLWTVIAEDSCGATDTNIYTSDICETNTAPTITAVREFTDGDNLPFHVSAAISDRNGNITSVQVVQSVTTGEPAITFTLYDDGTHGDFVPYDGIYEYFFTNEDQRYSTDTTGHLWTITAEDSCGDIDINYL